MIERVTINMCHESMLKSYRGWRCITTTNRQMKKWIHLNILYITDRYEQR